MIQFLVDTIFVLFEGNVFQQSRYSNLYNLCPSPSRYISVVTPSWIHTVFALGRKKQLASQFNFTYRYFEDVFTIKNPDFEEHPSKMYLTELEIKDTMASNTTSYLD